MAEIGSEMLFLFKNKYQYTYLNTYIALYFRAPKLPVKHTHTTHGNSFPSLLKLIPSLANYPTPSIHPPFTGSLAFTHPNLSFQTAHKKWGRQAGVCMCSGKYTDIHFQMKITYPIRTLSEHIHSTICTIDMDGGMCCINKKAEANREQ